jgi:hypothetical protein
VSWKKTGEREREGVTATTAAKSSKRPPSNKMAGDGRQAGKQSRGTEYDTRYRDRRISEARYGVLLYPC